MSAEAFGEGGSNPESFRGGILDCFVARAPRNDEEERASATLRPLVPRTQRSVPPAMRSIVRFDDALPSRGPSIRNCRVTWGSGSAPQRPTRCSLSGTRESCIVALERARRRWRRRPFARQFCRWTHLLQSGSMATSFQAIGQAGWRAQLIREPPAPLARNGRECFLLQVPRGARRAPDPER
ncbi:hypothetical protein EOW77_0008520 [Bradyrhizobium yuanmingense]|nr:hypothetical protein EOW77_0008520 [Bradyrhizobium yuanmingense]